MRQLDWLATAVAEIVSEVSALGEAVPRECPAVVAGNQVLVQVLAVEAGDWEVVVHVDSMAPGRSYLFEDHNAIHTAPGHWQ